MFLVAITALATVCGAAKLDRAYLPPPPSAKTAGGSPGSLQTSFFRNTPNQGFGELPKGAYNNEFDGVVVDVVAPGTRASSPDDSNLGAPRVSYGSIYSKVGEAAFQSDPVVGIRQLPEGTHFGLTKELTPNNKQHANFDTRPDTRNFINTSERAQAAKDRFAEIIRQENAAGPNSYMYAFETDNGILVEENAVESDGTKAQGLFKYKSDDGQVYSVTYTADSEGYRPIGDHIPTPPPIPADILKSLEQNARDEAAGVVDDGSYDEQKYNTGGNYDRRDSDNGQYKEQLFNIQRRPDLETNSKLMKEKNRIFGPQKLTSVQIGPEMNSNRASAEVTNTLQRQPDQFHFGYSNQPIDTVHKDSVKTIQNQNQEKFSEFDTQNRPNILSSVNFGSLQNQLKPSSESPNLHFGMHFQRPLTSSSPGKNNEHFSSIHQNSQVPLKTSDQFSYNNHFAQNGNNAAPNIFLTTPYQSNFSQRQNEMLQSGLVTKPFKLTNTRYQNTPMLPNIVSQNNPKFNIRPSEPAVKPLANPTLLHNLPLHSTQFSKTQATLGKFDQFDNNRMSQKTISHSNSESQLQTTDLVNKKDETTFQKNPNNPNYQKYQMPSQNDRIAQLNVMDSQNHQDNISPQHTSAFQYEGNHDLQNSNIEDNSYHYSSPSKPFSNQMQQFGITSASQSNSQFHNSVETLKQVSPQSHPNYFKLPTMAIQSQQYSGDLYEYTKPPKTVPATSNTATNSNTEEVYEYKKPAEISQPSPDMHTKSSVPFFQPVQFQSSGPTSQVQKFNSEDYKIKYRPFSLSSIGNSERMHYSPNSEITQKAFTTEQTPNLQLQTKVSSSAVQTFPLTLSQNSPAHTMEKFSHATGNQQISPNSQLDNKQQSFNSQSTLRLENQGFGPQSLTHSNLNLKFTKNFDRHGEMFNGPREPPRFDETGYHY